MSCFLMMDLNFSIGLISGKAILLISLSLKPFFIKVSNSQYCQRMNIMFSLDLLCCNLYQSRKPPVQEITCCIYLDTIINHIDENFCLVSDYVGSLPRVKVTLSTNLPPIPITVQWVWSWGFQTSSWCYIYISSCV